MTDRIVLYSESTANRLDLASGQTAQNSYTIPHAGGSFQVHGGRTGAAVAGSECLFLDDVFPIGSAEGPTYGRCQLLDNQANPIPDEIVYAHMPRLAVEKISANRYGIIQYFGHLRDCQDGQDPPICHTGWVITHAECEPDEDIVDTCVNCGTTYTLDESFFELWNVTGCVSPSGNQNAGARPVTWDATSVRLEGKVSIPISANSVWYVLWIVSSTNKIPFQSFKIDQPSLCGPLDAQIGIEGTWDEITQTLQWSYWSVSSTLFQQGEQQTVQIADFTDVLWILQSIKTGDPGLYDLRFAINDNFITLPGQTVHWLDPWYWGIRIENIGDQPGFNPDRGRVDSLDAISVPCDGPINVP